ncbi:MAG: excinuclease ABC subunit UvrA, partial [Planctomycetota bacterium]|nr:excinuclease ABC subunit UvrA [Planctomycetota bacterium]
NSVVVIEHNLDVIASADHVIDLGPEGGAGGGRIVASGSPEELCSSPSSHTGKALKDLRAASENDDSSTASAEKRESPPAQPGHISVEGAALNNLKGVDVEIPHGKLTVLTGVSGSGKSTLAFGTLFAEGQRRYLDSLSTYARRFLGTFNSPPVEKITGLAPAIAIDQKSTSSGPRSTVATLTEIHDYLRLLYAHIGEPHCPECEQLLRWTTPSALAQELVQGPAGEKLYILAPMSLPSQGQEELRKTLNELLKGGCTRVLAGEEEIRLDEGEDAALRRVLNYLSSTEPEEKQWLNPVVDRVLVSESSQSRIAAAIEDSFSRTGGATALKFAGGELQRHYRHPSCPAGHFTFAGSLTPRMFSFNSFEGACPACRGIGSEPRVEVNELISHPSMPLKEALSPELQGYLGKFRTSSLLILKAIERHLGLGEGYAVSELSPEDLQILLEGAGDEKISLSLKMGHHEAGWPGLVPLLEQWAREKDPNLSGAGIDNVFETRRCSACSGHRLRPESLGVRVGDRKLHQVLSLTIFEAREFFRELQLDSQRAVIAGDVLRELSNRLRFLVDTGLGYLSLNRQGNTLSGGEAQRIRLASQLGNRLTGAVYILDEPTIGLHESDTSGLLRCLADLKEAGNTVIVVEHDRKMIEAADHMIDLGPGAGEEGGLIVSQGSPHEVKADKASLTGAYLRSEKKVGRPRNLRSPAAEKIHLRGVNLHNLSNLDAAFPCGLLTAVSGVSGSGKSTLVMNILSEAIRAHLRKETNLEHAEEISGLDSFSRLVTVDQKSIGRSPRSTPATYAGAWSLIRALYARMPLAMSRGYNMGRFSFNSAEGQCPGCEGQGQCQVEMQFLSDIWVTCEECRGKRFNKSTLEVIFKGKNIADVLEMDIDEACGFFTNQPMILKFLRAMNDVGLGYLKLGQSSPTLSTGEAQRVKLAAELAGDRIDGTIYILDEPTTGLHFSETEKLLEILNRLVDGGGTVILIEHNMELIMAADWVVDMGPGAGP